MLNKEIYEGMTVRSADGTKLGKVDRIADGSFTIEKGLISKKRHDVAFTDIMDVRGDDIFLNTGWETAFGTTATERREGDVSVPLMAEELDVVKRDREAGRLRITKDVEIEERQVTVPVRREEVRVERVPASGRTPAAGEARFAKEEFTVPIHEEELEIRKRPVVKEEVRVARSAYEEEKEIREPLRRETVDVRREGSLEGPAAPRTSPDKDRY